jgi:CheY-like chemotaxis protein
MKSFLLIEDDDIFNFIHNQIILQASPDAKITIFKYAQQALDYLIQDPENLPDVIFLDLNMPEMNGFEFIDNLINHFDQKSIMSKLYLVSSTLDHRDKDRAKSYFCVKGMIDKPLTTSFIESLLIEH